MASNCLPAAQYLRMSTEHQQYSMVNQSAAIQRYAEANGFAISQTYSDAAKSGLVLKNRSGLRQLLQDAVCKPSFKVILVYDVSRWGRFQDTDEAAHYEFICKQAGVPVHYVAESFPNDASLPALVMKTVKRMMAGEYSRELSVKVYEGCKRVSQLGFHVGSIPGYGYRRMLVSKEGTRKQQLGQGQRKNIKEDRVILVPGPPEEVSCVRDIFRMYVHEQRPPLEIAEELNRRGIKYHGLRRTVWYSTAISRILSDMKYAGCNVYGKRSQRLRTPNITVPKEKWIITPRAWEPIIDQATFDKAQERTRNQTFYKSNEQLLADLRGLLASKGYLTEQLIKETPGFPSMQAYRTRFGSLSEALVLLGYAKARITNTMTRRMRVAMRDDLIRQIVTADKRVSQVRHDGRYRPELRLWNGTLVSVYVCPSFQIKSGESRWLLNRDGRAPNHTTLMARLKAGNNEFEDFWVVPKSKTRTRWTIGITDPWLERGQRIKSIAGLVDVVLRVKKRR
jgi:DNA invertase Pin-like site-specific DNA recombinase